MNKNTEKITVTGNYIERRRYEKSVKRAALPSRNGGRKSVGNSINSERYRLQTINTQQATVRRRVLGNFGVGSYVFTLTFAEHTPDLEEANIEFKNFIDRLRTKFKGINVKYLAVYEFTKKGSIHFHMITNISSSELLLGKLWGNGKEIKIDIIQSIEQLQATASYFIKGFKDLRIGSRTPYKASRNLAQSEKYFEQEEIEVLNNFYCLNERCPNIYRNYHSEFNGNIEFEGFILDPDI
jgi:hypothetical protein